jgi:hypothetical protein
MTNDTTIRPDVLEVIRRTFPKGVVDMPLDLEENYFDRVYPKLRARLARLKGATILYERDGAGEIISETGEQRRWSGRDDDDEDFADDREQAGSELSSSYHVFFVGLTDPRWQRPCETEEEVDDQGTREIVEGTDTFGCSVGVSLLAPMVIIKLNGMSQYDNGDRSIPDIDGYYEDADGRHLSADDFYRDAVDAPTFQVLQDLRAAITRVLGSVRIPVLAAEEADKPVPWLRAGEGAFVGKKATGHDITVRDAFFFRGP